MRKKLQCHILCNVMLLQFSHNANSIPPIKRVYGYRRTLYTTAAVHAVLRPSYPLSDDRRTFVVAP
ncbi:MAG: hypothetical protein HG447_007755 [Prevotella sp.]|nr:hypothetical protein [Prevotella sp.]